MGQLELLCKKVCMGFDDNTRDEQDEDVSEKNSRSRKGA